jgi:hypothetical protein
MVQRVMVGLPGLSMRPFPLHAPLLLFVTPKNSYNFLLNTLNSLSACTMQGVPDGAEFCWKQQESQVWAINEPPTGFAIKG